MVHTWEMLELRIWVVTFLTLTAIYIGSGGGIFTLAIILGLVDIAISVAGNKVDQNCGCR
jgi:hypothetical protein